MFHIVRGQSSGTALRCAPAMRYSAAKEFAMATLTISPDVQTQLHDVAARAGRAPDELAAEVLARGLEDWTDYLAAIDVRAPAILPTA